MPKLFLMRFFFMLFFSMATTFGFTQISKVTIQASGLTCSMCSNAINKSIRSLKYVDEVVADIKNSSFVVTFKNSDLVSFDELKNKVESAGFAVAHFEAVMHFDNVQVENDTHLNIGGVFYHFLNVKDGMLNGDKTIQVLDKGFVTRKEYKQNAIYTTMECYKTGVMGSCCDKKVKHSGSRIYHITI